MTGKKISHYHILEKLGQGGMGTVYKARDTKLDRFVALKFLPQHLSQDEENKKRFVYEAKAASALNHPNIATIYEIDEADGQMFIAMEYIKGPSLQEMMSTPLSPPSKGDVARPLPLDDATNYAIQIAEGLAQAHAKGIIHRDIKPANILITEDGVVKLVDFGLAKLTGRTQLTKEGTTLGTIAYMSPEQAQGAQVDHRTDIWALGAVLYEMVAGRPPFQGDYDQAIMYAIMNEDAEPLTALRTGVPTKLERVGNKALAKTPAERYQHADEMFVDLKAIQKELRQRGETADTAANLVRAKPPARAWSPKPASIFGVAVLVLVATVGLWWLMRGRRLVQPSATEQPEKKLAVLPFLNLTADPKQEYFCDGMTEQLITNLSRIPGLKVIARTSVMRYKNTQKDIRQISKELGTKYVLEGSVRKAGNKLRVTAQLIEAEEGTHLWANDYDRELRDIFAIQDDVSQAIARALEVAFSDRAAKMVAAGYSSSVEAYDLHLRTRYYIDNVYLKTKQESDFQQALAQARQAVTLDPDHYLGYLDLAYLYENHWVVTGSSRDMEMERTYIRKAYQLNPELPETNAAMGMQFLRSAQYDSAFSYLKAALAQPGNSWEPLHLIGTSLAYLGLHQRAISFFNKAAELNPFSFYTLANRGSAWLLVGEIDQAQQDFARTYRIRPDFVANLSWYALSYLIEKQYPQADSVLTVAEKQPPGAFDDFLKFGRALYFAALDQKEKALGLSRWGGVLAVLGMKEEAITAIEHATKIHSGESFISTYLPLIHLPVYDSLRSEPRFQQIVKREKEKYEKRLQKYAVALRE